MSCYSFQMPKILLSFFRIQRRNLLLSARLTISVESFRILVQISLPVLPHGIPSELVNFLFFPFLSKLEILVQVASCF